MSEQTRRNEDYKCPVERPEAYPQEKSRTSHAQSGAIHYLVSMRQKRHVSPLKFIK